MRSSLLVLRPLVLALNTWIVATQLRFVLVGNGVSSSVSADLPTIQNKNSNSNIRSNPITLSEEYFGACLMIKDDNSLLDEWLAYHYTKLPLRYVYLAVDDNDSRQDPRDVTQKWEEEQGLGMTFWVVNVSEFASSTSSPNQSYTNSSNSTTTTSKEEAHHDFIHRQRAFITECTRFLQQQGVHWTTYIDTDEFIVINHLGHEDYNDDNNNTRKGPSFQPSREEFRAARRDLPPMETQPTVLQVLKNSTITTITTTQYPACTSMPRLLYGALETTTCLEAQETLDFAQAHFPRRYSDLSTLRFEQHARKGDFQKSRWGKVLMNVSGVPQDILNDNNSHSPRNIHRPWKEVCGPAAVHFPDAIFYVNHYIGSWERYNSRSYDARRNRDEWEQRAYLSDGRSCDKRIHEWLPEFVEQVGGLDTAKRLLGQ